MPMRESMREKARENNKYFVKFDDHGLEKRHNKFCNIDRDLEQDHNTYTTKNGNKIHILCSYGNNY